MSVRVVIQHLSGSKANQIEQFEIDSPKELSLGRDPSSTIAFDPQRDDAVSRNHAAIRASGGERPSFVILDKRSANGTLLNGTRISGETELLPDDTVQLGVTGPTFRFDVQPRPSHLVARTKVISEPATRETRIVTEGNPAVAASNVDSVAPPVSATVRAASGSASNGPPPTTSRPGVGRNTVMGMLAAERQATTKKWMYVVAALLVLIGGVGGGLYYRMRSQAVASAAEAEQQLRLAKADTERRLREVQEKAAVEQAAAEAAQRRLMEQKIGMPPSEIIRKFGNATVSINVRWRLSDRETGKALFHKRSLFNGELLPAYIRMDNDHIVRWLTTEDNNHQNREVGSSLSGTGFVISAQGFILTNKHVAAGWAINYNQYSDYETGKGVVFDLKKDPKDKKLPEGKPFDLTGQSAWFRRLINWTPEDGGEIFNPDQPMILAGRTTCACEGRNEVLEVQFPESRNTILARLVQISKDADVALIKVDSLEPLVPLELATDDNVTVGGAITVLGYPASSMRTLALSSTIENGERRQQSIQIPVPTVTPGVISRLSGPTQQQGSITVIAPMGDVYQLTAAVGAGASGGPVFDANGKVIAIFTYASSVRETTTWAVPIKYGNALLPVQRRN
jgi:serine protease Do